MLENTSRLMLPSRAQQGQTHSQQNITALNEHTLAPSVAIAFQTQHSVAPRLAMAGALALHLGVIALAAFYNPNVEVPRPQATQGTSWIEVDLPAAPPPELARGVEPAIPAPARIPERAKPTPALRAAQERVHPQVAHAPIQSVSALAATAKEAFADSPDSTGAGHDNTDGASARSETLHTAARKPTALTMSSVTGHSSGTAPVLDRSRRPVLAGGASWDCPFPPEAEERGIDQASVSLSIEVAADGGVLAATVTSDPGCGFGREAHRCALHQRWSPGLDRWGAPIRAVAHVNVRFQQR
jgi:periplasmic protein TonB